MKMEKMGNDSQEKDENKKTSIQIDQQTMSVLKEVQVLFMYRDKQKLSLNDVLYKLLIENKNDIIK